jgi:hypothetical protein
VNTGDFHPKVRAVHSAEAVDTAPRSNLRYRLEWWIPLELEWAGAWQLFMDKHEVCSAALDRITAGCAAAHVLIIQLDTNCIEVGRSVASATELSNWSRSGAPLPGGSTDVLLPPMGRDDIEGTTLAGCRMALRAAVEADLLETKLVTAIVVIAQQAFAGIGPAVEFIADADV